ncbi:MAG: Gfo/Idh/MocA family oxidoreductase, partial [Bacteroidia bacterium]|nr:Gfo/Idh/MocA family oxidoreductase [Bacteroidia bacterium]
MEEQKKGWSRRKFLGASALGVAGLAVLPSISGFAMPADEKEITLGFVGLGQQANFLLNGFLQIPGVNVVAGCDVYGIKRKRFQKKVDAFNTKAGKTIKVETYEKYGDVLSRKDINAVVIAVPDHSHAYIAIAALKAGKDVYLE